MSVEDSVAAEEDRASLTLSFVSADESEAAIEAWSSAPVAGT